MTVGPSFVTPDGFTSETYAVTLLATVTLVRLIDSSVPDVVGATVPAGSVIGVPEYASLPLGPLQE